MFVTKSILPFVQNIVAYITLKMIVSCISVKHQYLLNIRSRSQRISGVIFIRQVSREKVCANIQILDPICLYTIFASNLNNPPQKKNNMENVRLDISIEKKYKMPILQIMIRECKLSTHIFYIQISTSQKGAKLYLIFRCMF